MIAVRKTYPWYKSSGMHMVIYTGGKVQNGHFTEHPWICSVY